jgi:ABC-type proline/glycine betaine transport system ATPase subunit
LGNREPAGGSGRWLGRDRFIDREDALKAVADLLDDDSPVRVLVVHGVSGMGKSTLLAHVARGQAGGYRAVAVDVDPVVRAMADPAGCGGRGSGAAA